MISSKKKALLALFLFAAPVLAQAYTITVQSIDPATGKGVGPVTYQEMPNPPAQSEPGEIEMTGTETDQIPPASKAMTDCMEASHAVANAAAADSLRSELADQKSLEQKKAKIEKIEKLRALSVEDPHQGYSWVPGCGRQRGADLYNEDGSHKTIKNRAGKEVDAVQVCETYVENKAKDAYRDLARSSSAKDKDSVEVFFGSVCVDAPEAPKANKAL
jgi:hypothetical protein